jgi:hypothetical protein
MTVTQLPFEWYQRTEAHEVGVVLEATTIETVITLMAQALIAVVRSAAHVEEAVDDH